MIPRQPTFVSPDEAIEFIRSCLDQYDANKLHAAFTEETNEFWEKRLFQYLRQIEDTETLKNAFLEDGRINTFAERESVLYLGGHNPRSGYIHITLNRTPNGWVVKSIHICR